MHYWKSRTLLAKPTASILRSRLIITLEQLIIVNTSIIKNNLIIFAAEFLKKIPHYAFNHDITQ